MLKPNPKTTKAKLNVVKPKVNTVSTSYLIDVVWDGLLWYNCTNLIDATMHRRNKANKDSGLISKYSGVQRGGHVCTKIILLFSLAQTRV